jgi:hypothetical protein
MPARRRRQIVEDAVELAGIELRRRNVRHPHLRGAAPARPACRPDPDRAGAAEPAEERRRGHRRRPSARQPRRHIELRVVPRHTPDEGGGDRVQRHRHGPGLPEEVMARLYEAFFSTKAEGLGIGLSLCRSIVESHRGRIKARTSTMAARCVGCRFAFTLPVDCPSRARSRRQAPASPRCQRMSPSRPSPDQPSSRHPHEPDPQEGHRLRRR